MTPKQEKERRLALATAHNDFTVGLNSYANYKVNNKETGEDLVQDTFIKTWKFLVKGGEIASMKSFLYHVLNNLIVDEYRKRKHKTVSLDILIEGGFEPGSDDSERITNILDGRSAILMIQSLPEIYKKVIKMRYVQDLSLKEISAITGKTENSIAVQVHRGVEKLKILCKVV